MTTQNFRDFNEFKSKKDSLFNIYSERDLQSEVYANKSPC